MRKFRKSRLTSSTLQGETKMLYLLKNSRFKKKHILDDKEDKPMKF